MSAIENQQRATRVWRRRMVTVGFGFGALMAGSVAMAAFTANSQPWAKGQVATVTQPNAVASVTGAVWPGDCNDVSLTVHNTNAHSVTITSVGNTGFRNVNDPKGTEAGQPNRVLDFLYQADVSNALTGKQVGAGAYRTFTIPDAVCLKPDADDARQGSSFEAGYFVAYQVDPGTETGGR